MPLRRVELTAAAWRAELAEFGEQLRERRVHVLRLSQAELATRVGLNQSTISRIEAGHHPRNKAMAVALSKAYGLPAAATKLWLELLYGSTSLFEAEVGSESWGSRLEYAYTLLARLQANHAPPSRYFYPPLFTTMSLTPLRPTLKS